MRRFGYTTFILALLLPLGAHAALININTADAALLDTLPGIGPSKAAAIIDYRTLNGPFAQIQDIQNVSGIGAATYADIASLITVDSSPASSGPVSSTASSTSPTATTTTPSSTGTLAEYLTRPTLRIAGVSDRVVSVGADTVFTVVVYDGKGNRRPDASASWSFGDGTRRMGTSVYHAYYAPGEYIVMVRASVPEGDEAEFEVLVTAKEARLAIQDISDKGVTLINHDSRIIDLSGWRLVAGEREFKLPPDTFMLGNKTLMFSPRVTGLPFTGSVRLLYPNGDVADVYPRVAAQTLSVPVAPKVQAAASISAPAPAAVSFTPQEEEVEDIEDVPLAAAVAAFPEESEEGSSSGGMVSSPWFLGLLSLVILSGAAFVFL